MRAALGQSVRCDGFAAGMTPGLAPGLATEHSGQSRNRSPSQPASPSPEASYSIATGSRVLDDFLRAPLYGNRTGIHRTEINRTGILVEWLVGNGSFESRALNRSASGRQRPSESTTGMPTQSVPDASPGTGAPPGTGTRLGTGGGWLAFAAAWGACGSERMLVVLDRDRKSTRLNFSH